MIITKQTNIALHQKVLHKNICFTIISHILFKQSCTLLERIFAIQVFSRLCDKWVQEHCICLVKFLLMVFEKLHILKCSSNGACVTMLVLIASDQNPKKCHAHEKWHSFAWQQQAQTPWSQTIINVSATAQTPW